MIAVCSLLIVLRAGGAAFGISFRHCFRQSFSPVPKQQVPGITAALSAAALLGAPLGHDFCVISLSDRLTEQCVIEQRLRCAAEGDFVICLYNPASVHRPDYLQRACRILLEIRGADTVCGIVRNIGRTGQSIRILTLSELSDTVADMFTTVLIGSSRTIQVQDKMVTPRGYRR